MAVKQIPVYIITGQLDSGKTSFVKDTMMEQDWLENGTTLYVLCEEGEYELPELYRKNRRITQITADDPEVFTTQYCEDLLRTYSPSQIIIEFNGMWNLQDFLKKDFPKSWGLAGIYSTVDGSSLELLMMNMRNLFMNQLIESDFVVVNRCPQSLNRVPFRKALKLQNPGAQVIFEGEDGKIIEFGEEDLPYDLNAPVIELDDVDYGTWYADAFESPERYKGKKIRFLAQFFRPFGMAKNMFVPGRLVMACCAADIKFYGFPCKSDKSMRFENKSWHRITAEFAMDKKRDPRTGQIDAVPVLRFISAEDAPAPAEEVVTL